MNQSKENKILQHNRKNGNKNIVLNEKQGLFCLFSLNLFKISELEIFYANIRV